MTRRISTRCQKPTQPEATYDRRGCHDSLPQVYASPCTHRRMSHRCWHRRRFGARLSDQAGAHRRRLWPERRHRHHGAPHGTMAVGAARSGIYHREPSRSRRQYRHRGSRESGPGRLYAAFGVSPNAINATLYDKLNFNILTDVVPVAGIMRMPHIMLVHPSFPAKTVPEFIAYARANPGKVNMGSAGIGSTNHISGELLNMMAGVKMVHVPYRAAGSVFSDLVAAQVHVLFCTAAASIEYVRAGTLRALAVTGVTRLEALPGIPTVDETLPGYETTLWGGVVAPKATSAEIVGKLNKEIKAGLADSKLKARLAVLGGTMLPGSPEDFGKLIADETEKWGKVVKFSGARVE